MNIFVTAYIVCIILGVLHNLKYLSKKSFCISTGIIYFLLASLRHRTVGGDTDIYCSWFQRVATENIYEVLLSEKKDPIFAAAISLLGKITINYTVFLTIIALIFTTCIWRLIYKHSKDPCLSIIILLALNLYQFSLTGIRQTIAMSLVSIHFCHTLTNNKTSLHVLPAIGALFHKSALITYLWKIIELPYKTVSKKSIVVFYLCITFIIISFRNTVALLLGGAISERGYSISNEGGGENMALLIISLYIFCLFIARKNFKDDKLRILFIMTFPVIIFEALVPLQNIFFRLAFYFLILYIILIPECIQAIKKIKYRQITSILIYITLSCLYLFLTINSSYVLPYKFFWE